MSNIILFIRPTQTIKIKSLFVLYRIIKFKFRTLILNKIFDTFDSDVLNPKLRNLAPTYIHLGKKLNLLTKVRAV